jgi:coproporphyrinogen III oxidase-like Fe-S oxidoreductase
MGMQAMNDADLRAFGRLHTAQEALQAFDVARHCFDRVSFDLIYARQGQSLIQWEAELNSALGLAVDHLSLYQLTIEEGTAFGDRYARGKLRGLPNEDLSADMFELTQDLCEARGFLAYEVSNHARPGAESVHNRIYWNSGDYLGIGPGAHGRITLDGVRYCTEATRNPGAWMKQLRDTGTGESVRAALSKSEQADEFILMGLRLTTGLDLRRLLAISGLAPSQSIMLDLQDHGLIHVDSDRIRTTPKGRMVLNHVIKELAASLQPIRSPSLRAN